MSRLTYDQREALKQSLREGFCWALAAFIPFVAGPLVADTVLFNSTFHLLDALYRLAP